MQLRPYQQAALDCLDAWMTVNDGNAAIVIPTGGGKSPCMAFAIQRYLTHWPQTRICILAHVRELVEQNAQKLLQIWPEAPLGIYSAGLRRRDSAPVLFASIQSVYKRAQEIGPFDLIFVDEAHRIPVSGEGMYRQFIADCLTMSEHMRVIGWTATPYRLGAGMVIGKHRILNAIAYEISVRTLIDQGYLSRLVTKGSRARPELGDVHVRQGDYVADELEAAMVAGDLVERTAKEIVRLAADRRAWLVFCVGKAHAEQVSAALFTLGVEAPVIHEGTPSDVRDMLVSRFRTGKLRALCNINVLSEGFDAPHVDCIVMLRPTKSAGMYYQQCGRGLRQSPGKADCLVLDFAGNVLEHGPIDAIVPPHKKGAGKKGPPVRQCPECQLYVPISAQECPECGHQFPLPERDNKHDDKAHSAPILKERAPIVRVEIARVEYQRHEKPGKIPSMRVDYYAKGLLQRFSEWICIEHTGYPRQKAEAWWSRRLTGYPCVDSVDEAIEACEFGALREPSAIMVDTNGKYPEIIDYEFTANARGESGNDRDLGVGNEDRPLFA